MEPTPAHPTPAFYTRSVSVDGITLPPLLRFLRGELPLQGIAPPELDLLLRQARAALLLPRLAIAARDRGLLCSLPLPARQHLEAALTHAAAQRRALAWELERLAAVFEGAGHPVILLKGAAYGAMDLPFAEGRLFGDIDLLVPRERLEESERRLLFAGWLPVQLDAYDRRYFRQWMHEVPPLKHAKRGSQIDLHHTILPPTSRFHCDTPALFEAAVPLAGTPFSTLAPEDLVLHSAAHLYTEGELEHGLRDLVDLDGLLRHFAGADRRLSAVGCRQSANNQSPAGWTEQSAIHQQSPSAVGLRHSARNQMPMADGRTVDSPDAPPTLREPRGQPPDSRQPTADGQSLPVSDFYTRLVARANATGLGRPLAHALRHCRDLLATPLPPGLEETIEDRPGFLSALLLDACCYRRALLPYHPSCRSPARSLADFLLYVRGHWLRMPLRLLLPHLVLKAWKRRFGGPAVVRGGE